MGELELVQMQKLKSEITPRSRNASSFVACWSRSRTKTCRTSRKSTGARHKSRHLKNVVRLVPTQAPKQGRKIQRKENQAPSGTSDARSKFTIATASRTSRLRSN